ncbi:hypothetical protein CEXT_587731 [Caerostris extrusa]|uniref:Uncharacterized protein n=1 Tax=Caerostris extrusa TaxID=172846 RepID=A0AAV4PY47_CAEEX|nr:hypothetical protein CEXT_587731 [Caerostris extrusa]
MFSTYSKYLDNSNFRREEKPNGLHTGKLRVEVVISMCSQTPVNSRQVSSALANFTPPRQTYEDLTCCGKRWIHS